MARNKNGEKGVNIDIIGAGAWGTAIGKVLRGNSHAVRYIERSHAHWPQGNAPDYIFLALPCQTVRARLSPLDVPPAPMISLTKGIEIGTGLRVTQILQQILTPRHLAALSGPNFAVEVERQAPTATVVASSNQEFAQTVQSLLHQKFFRVYRSDDLIGVELGGALKNIYAIAAGICVGLNIGDNGMAGLLTRSLAEMARIGCVLGAKKETFFGLSGIGDLMLTAYGGRSRNHQVGEAIGKGATVEEALKSIIGVAEGVPTTEAVFRLAREKGLKTPVLDEVHKILYESKPPLTAFHDLMLRQVEAE
ncbi:MAG: NAD(P)H-dependent glycerol-3-phosphate dehydrogenase [bacterium]